MAHRIGNPDQLHVTALVRASQRGDREAFGELFSRFERTVFAIALRRLGDYNEAEELCQDVFMQALLKIGQLREPASFGAWLRGVKQEQQGPERNEVQRLVRGDARQRARTHNASPFAADVRAELITQIGELQARSC